MFVDPVLHTEMMAPAVATKSTVVTSTRYLARQPILDSRENVFGYELLFRGGPETLFSARNSDHASLSTMDYSLTLANSSFTNGKRAFINCTRELLVSGLVTLLPADQTVLEILEDIEPDPAVVSACRHLHTIGYSFALDDFTSDRLGTPFLDIATFVKVDLRANPASQIGPLAVKLARRGLRLIAEKVESREELDCSLQAGYHLFQGYFFCKPTIVKSRDISTAQLNQLRLLQTTVDPELDLRALEMIIRSDVSLCYRLLRYLNSAAFGLYPVRSIMHALTLLGEREVRKWIALVTAASLGGNKTPELVRLALVRAKVCEFLAPRKDAEDYFLAGLFSLLDTMLERPMPQLVAELPVSPQCREALLGLKNPIFTALTQCMACETADLKAESNLPWDAYHQATIWADSLLATSL